MSNYSIRDLAEEFDVTTRTMRFYESEGLLHPRREGQTRIYTDKDRIHLKLILRGKRLGLSLAESKELIELYNPSGANQKQLLRLLEKLSERRKSLEQQIEDIRVMQHELDEAEVRCRDALNALESNKTETK